MTEVKQPPRMTNQELEQMMREYDDETINFFINVNDIIGNVGHKTFHILISAINMSLYILQREKKKAHTYNIEIIANGLLETSGETNYVLNRAEIICLLYFIEKNMDTISMNIDTNDLPTWKIHDNIFDSLCEDD